MTAYYNEHDPGAAAWLRELIKAGHIAAGVVDERSIEDVPPNELREFTQCHFFAGIGGWSYALRLAGWPDDRPLWTGSCPCQSFSTAGQGKGFADERHLWPAFHHLIRECRPPVVFGEQVEAAVRHGWLDLVFSDMEGEGYACGAAVLGAHSVGAPHIRQRLYWVAESHRVAGGQRRPFDGRGDSGGDEATWPGFGGGIGAGWMADTDCRKCDGVTVIRGAKQYGENPGRQESRGIPRACGETDVLANGSSQGLEVVGQQPAREKFAATERGGEIGWSRIEWLACADEKSRPTQPGLFPLAHGVPARVVRLRGYGNAVVPQAAAEFIRASLG